MKNIKRFAALLIAALLLLAMAVPAMADDEPVTGSITMAASADGTVAAANKAFKAYKVLDVTYDGDAYAYTVPAALVSAMATAFEVPAQGGDETDIAYNQKIVKAIETAATADVEAVAKKLLKLAKDNGVTAADITGTTPTTGLPLGYYVIEDVTSTGDDVKPVSAVALTTTNPDVTISVKASKPPLDKRIDEGDTAGEYEEAKDPKYDNHAVGDTVPYILRSTVPDMTGYTKYFFIVNDTLSKGLTFNNDVVVKITKAAVEDDPATTDVNEAADAVTRTLTADSDYTVSYETDSTTKETAVKIVFKDFVGKEKAHAGEEIIITYSATVNTDAVIGVAGNPNTAKLIFSNDPNTTPHSETDEPDDHDTNIVSETTEQKTYTYVTGIEIIKKDKTTKELLANAEFKIEATNLLNTVLVEKDKFVQDANGTYFALKDGTYTQDDPTKLDTEATNYDELIAKYEDPTGATKFKKTFERVEVIEKAEDVVYSGTTDANGSLVFNGLMAGTYTLTELKAPDGYNMLKAPLTVEITWTAPADNAAAKDCTWESTGHEIQDGVVVVEIENEKGNELPTTGGFGTTLFYLLGAALMIVTAVLMVTKRRVSD